MKGIWALCLVRCKRRRRAMSMTKISDLYGLLISTRGINHPSHIFFSLICHTYQKQTLPLPPLDALEAALELFAVLDRMLYNYNILNLIKRIN
jgi:hypothetical protein